MRMFMCGELFNKQGREKISYLRQKLTFLVNAYEAECRKTTTLKQKLDQYFAEY